MASQVSSKLYKISTQIFQFAVSATKVCAFSLTIVTVSARSGQAVHDTSTCLVPRFARIHAGRDHSQDPLLVQWRCAAPTVPKTAETPIVKPGPSIVAPIPAPATPASLPSVVPTPTPQQRILYTLPERPVSYPLQIRAQVYNSPLSVFPSLPSWYSGSGVVLCNEACEKGRIARIRTASKPMSALLHSIHQKSNLRLRLCIILLPHTHLKYLVGLHALQNRHWLHARNLPVSTSQGLKGRSMVPYHDDDERNDLGSSTTGRRQKSSPSYCLHLLSWMLR
ncbi:hypothetical protein JOM56_014703 [Amanita muscaria]